MQRRFRLKSEGRGSSNNLCRRFGKRLVLHTQSPPLDWVTILNRPLPSKISRRAAFVERRIAVNHAIRSELLWAVYNSTLEPLLVDPIPQKDYQRLLAD